MGFFAPRCAMLAVLVAGSSIALAQTPTLVKDLSPGFVVNSSDPKAIWSNGAVAYGWCAGGLFRTDGTTAGTWIVYDPANGGPGPGPSDQRPLFGLSRTLACTSGFDPFTHKFQARLLSIDPQGRSASPMWSITFGIPTGSSFTSATIGDFILLGDPNYTPNGPAWDLWRTDGTDAGTTRLLAGVSPFAFQPAGDRAYFTGANLDAPGERDLWVSDGTLAGTHIVPGFPYQIYAKSPQLIGNIGHDALIHRLSSANRWELWRTDGTDENTIRLADGPGVPDYAIAEIPFAQVDDRTYFVPLSSPSTGLWVTLGTAGTTHAVAPPPGYTSQTLRGAGAGGAYVDAANASGHMLGVLDSNDQFTPLWASATGALVIRAAHVVYITRSSGGIVVELAVTNGSAAGTHSINIPSTLHPNSFAAVGDKLVFNGTDASGDKELWVTDGTDQGTHVLADMVGNNPSTSSLDLIPTPHGMVFAGNDTLNLFVTDGTPAGTSPLSSPIAHDPNPTGIVLKYPAATQTFYTVGSTSSSNYRSLWVTDGTSAGTRAILEQPSGGGMTNALTQVILGDKIVFAGLIPGTTTGDEPMVSDGTILGTRRLADINPGSEGSAPGNLMRLGSLAFFRATAPATGSEPWITDGTPEGTMALGDLNPGTGNSSPTPRGVVGNRLYFTTNFSSVTRLWSTDGTPAGTRPVNDTSGNPFQCTSFKSASTGGDRFYFAAVDAVGNSIWRVSPDGATAERRWVAGPTSASAIYSLLSFNGQGAFWATPADATQTGLWITDETPTGAHLLLAFPPSQGGSIPSNIIVHNGLLIFIVYSSTTYGAPSVLWRSDGTPEGTVPVTTTQPFSQYFGGLPGTELLSALPGGPLMFSGSTETAGYERFVTDGYQIRPIEIVAGPRSSHAGFPVVSGGVVYLAADDGVVGQELWSVPLADIQFPPHCDGDFNLDGALDFFDYDDFVVCFEGGACPPGNPAPTADFDHDGTIDFFDYDAFVVAFETGC